MLVSEFSVFCDMTLYHWVRSSPHVRATLCLCLQWSRSPWSPFLELSAPEDDSTMFLWNVRKHPKTQHHSPKDLKFQKLCCRTSNLTKVKGRKGEVHPTTGHKGPDWEGTYTSTLALTSTLDGGGWSMPRPGCFSPRKDPVHIVWEAGWTPRPVWMGVSPPLGFNPGLSST